MAKQRNLTGRAAQPVAGDLARFGAYGFEIRASDGEGAAPVMAGQLLAFNEWNEIDSRSEGHFMESIAPEAVEKTLSERSHALQVLFDHGDDPAIGRKPLGRPRSFTPDGDLLNYEVDLLDADYVRSLMPGLEAGLYGMSWTFRNVRVDETQFPKRSDYNPAGLPERRIREMMMREFGPTPFPVYKNTSAGVRSLTDELRQPSISVEQLRSIIEPSERLDTLVAEVEDADQEAAPADPITAPARRGSSHLYGESRKEGPEWRIP